MKSLLTNHFVNVWMVLMLLSVASWSMSISYSAVDTSFYQYVSMVILILAFIKVRLVIMHFMEVADAPLPLRIIMDGWSVVVCFLIIVFGFAGIYPLQS